jgi:hypothetical protein
MIRLPCGLLVRFVRTTAGAIGARLSPRPLFLERVKLTQASGASRREKANLFATLSQRHCERSEAIHLPSLLRQWIASLRSQ